MYEPNNGGWDAEEYQTASGTISQLPVAGSGFSGWNGQIPVVTYPHNTDVSLGDQNHVFQRDTASEVGNVSYSAGATNSDLGEDGIFAVLSNQERLELGQALKDFADIALRDNFDIFSGKEVPAAPLDMKAGQKLVSNELANNRRCVNPLQTEPQVNQEVFLQQLGISRSSHSVLPSAISIPPLEPACHPQYTPYAPTSATGGIQARQVRRLKNLGVPSFKPPNSFSRTNQGPDMVEVGGFLRRVIILPKLRTPETTTIKHRFSRVGSLTSPQGVVRENPISIDILKMNQGEYRRFLLYNEPHGPELIKHIINLEVFLTNVLKNPFVGSLVDAELRGIITKFFDGRTFRELKDLGESYSADVLQPDEDFVDLRNRIAFYPEFVGMFLNRFFDYLFHDLSWLLGQNSSTAKLFIIAVFRMSIRSDIQTVELRDVFRQCFCMCLGLSPHKKNYIRAYQNYLRICEYLRTISRAQLPSEYEKAEYLLGTFVFMPQTQTAYHAILPALYPGKPLANNSPGLAMLPYEYKNRGAHDALQSVERVIGVCRSHIGDVLRARDSLLHFKKPSGYFGQVFMASSSIHGAAIALSFDITSETLTNMACGSVHYHNYISLGNLMGFLINLKYHLNSTM